jgi:radical SAM protein with 4Fe4S-binding SPASM domain
MGNVVSYIRERARSKGVLNVLSAVSRTYLGGAGAGALSDLAWLSRRAAGDRAPRFRLVAIETMSGCNYRCSFCPIGQIKLPSGRMSMELYLRILDQLGDFDGEIHPFLMNEPVLDRRIVEMCRLAKERTRARVVLQTNGSRLTEEVCDELTRHATVIVNDYTADNSVIARLKTYRSARALILVDRRPDAVLSNRAGNVPDRPVVKLDSFCVRPFEQLYIAHDGRVVLCCQDWSFEEVMGDATQSTLDEIWNGERYRQVRASLLRKERAGLCAKCDFPGI